MSIKHNHAAVKHGRLSHVLDFGNEWYNQRYYHFLERRYIKNYDPKTDFFVKYLPALADPPADVLKKLLGADPEPNVWDDVIDQNHPVKYETDLYTPMLDSQGKLKYNRKESEAAYKMAEPCHSLGATPIFITTPYLSEFTDHITETYPPFFDEFFEIIDQLCADTGTEYYNYCFDERFKDNYGYFSNPHHLNFNGATVFTKIVMEEILNIRTVSE